MLFHAVILAAATNPCADANTQSDLNVCWAGQAKQADAALNKTYQSTLAELKSLGVDATPLIDAQIAWISMRDKTCAFETALYEGGSIAPMIEWECVATLTQQRTARLQSYADGRKSGPPAAAAQADAKVDDELNRVYGLYLKQLTGAQKKLLTNSELAWLSYRDKACAVEGAACITELERERITDLENSWIGDKFW